MKRATFISFLVIAASVAGGAQSDTQVTTTDITYDQPVPPDEVVRWFAVFRQDSLYAVDFHAIHEGERYEFGFGYETAEEFDKVSFTWVEENAVAFRLFNSTTGQALKLKIRSDDPESAVMGIDD